MMTSSSPNEFLRVSAALGQNASLVQGAGGNSSLKSGDRILVKASGTKLADALDSDIFVELDLTAARRSVRDFEFASLKDAVVPASDKAPLRPSIETALHVIMPHECVAHVHALNSIAVSIQPDVSAEVERALKGLMWARIPYVMPGEPLARSVFDALSERPVDVVLLDNHGLVVGANTPGSAMEQILDVEERLSSIALERAEPDFKVSEKLLEECSQSDRFELIEDPRIQALAFDEIARSAVTSGTLYPDHVVFLGPSAVLRGCGESLAACAERAESQNGARSRLIISPNMGVAIDGRPSPTDLDMARCLADVAFRLQSSHVSFLSPSDALKLVNWDAEVYRRQINTD